jgi:TonB-linked SusC/RagA family outer membrane protein
MSFALPFGNHDVGEKARQTGQPVWKGSVVLTLFVLLLGLGAQPAMAQHEVSGEVTDAEEGVTLPGVNIVVKGTQIGTTTRANGSFTIEAPSPADTLIFSFVGYEEQEVPIDSRSEIDVELTPSVTALEEVVVEVGYGQQTIETTTGSVSQVSGEDLDAIPTTNLSQTLQGTVTGLIGVTPSGRPGGDNANLLIRGTSTLNNNSPLVVIDGVPGRQGGLSRLNPSDIESISVLKDASAAIYGSRAANGVILVKTKQGRAGETRINFNIERNWAQPTVVPEMADAPTFMQMLNEVDQYRGNPARYSQEAIEQHRNCPAGSYECFNTDWYDVALKDFSREISANASVTGGSETFQYRVSLEGITEEGILVNSATGYNQVGFRSNLNGDVTDNFNIALNLHGRLENREQPSWTRSGTYTAAWELLQRGKPNEPAFWPNGQPGPAQENGVNPVVSDQTGYNDEKIYYFQSNLTLGLEVPGVDGWSVEGTVAYDRQFEDQKRWQQPWTLYSWDGSTDESGDPVLTGVSVGVPDPRLQQWDENQTDILLRATSTYERTVGSHNGSLLLGTEWQSGEGDEIYAFRRFFPTNQIQELFAGGQSQQDLFGTSWHAARLNFFGRANYNYLQKYLFEVVARYDGSYIFPEGDRFGFFPSVSAGWRLAQEDWFNNWTSDFFDRLKIRGSYGQTGNDQVEPYQFLQTFGFNGQFAYGDGLGTRISQTRVPNRDITWEIATQFDLGLQGAVLGERLTFDFTYFRQSRDDILWFRNAAVPQTAGFSLPRENIAKVNSYGFEGQVGFSQQVASNTTLRFGANLTYATDEVEFFAEPDGVLDWQQNTGRPWDTDLYYLHDGIWNTQEEIDSNPSWPGARPGDVRFQDYNEDGVIDGADRVRVEENSTPDLIGSFNFGATVGNFDARLLFQGAAQVRQYVFTGSVGEFGNYYQEFAEERWTPDNPDASGPRAYNRVDPYWASNANTYFLRDAKYLRLKSARLGYSLPAAWMDQVGGFRQLQLYLSGRNLLTLTPLKVMDPELRNSSAHDYPLERAFTVGFLMGF